VPEQHVRLAFLPSAPELRHTGCRGALLQSPITSGKCLHSLLRPFLYGRVPFCSTSRPMPHRRVPLCTASAGHSLESGPESSQQCPTPCVGGGGAAALRRRHFVRSAVQDRKSSGCVAPVHVVILSGYEAGFVGCQEDHSIGKFVGIAHSLQENPLYV
jgi:hypothetical protein